MYTISLAGTNSSFGLRRAQHVLFLFVYRRIRYYGHLIFNVTHCGLYILINPVNTVTSLIGTSLPSAKRDLNSEILFVYFYCDTEIKYTVFYDKLLICSLSIVNILKSVCNFKYMIPVRADLVLADGLTTSVW